MAGLWPTVLTIRQPGGPDVVLRGLRTRDRAEWEEVRAANGAWLAPWEASNPLPHGALRFRQLVRYYDTEAHAGRMQPFAVETAGRLVGQMHLFGISWGSLRSAAAGYWIAQAMAGRGLAPLTLAAAVDHALYGMGLHRVEVNIRPENAASLRVVRKLGFRDEGLRLRYLHIDGAWRDHRSFALTPEDLDGRSLLTRWNDRRRGGPGRPTGEELTGDAWPSG